MKELFYSEDLDRTFETKDECLEAEKDYAEKLLTEKVKKQERSARAKELENAYKKASEAYKEADELLKEFCKDYGSFHTTLTGNDSFKFTDLFDIFFDHFI